MLPCTRTLYPCTMYLVHICTIYIVHIPTARPHRRRPLAPDWMKTEYSTSRGGCAAQCVQLHTSSSIRYVCLRAWYENIPVPYLYRTAPEHLLCTRLYHTYIVHRTSYIVQGTCGTSYMVMIAAAAHLQVHSRTGTIYSTIYLSTDHNKSCI